MVFKKENLLKDAGRGWELLIGWVCAAISTTFAVLFAAFAFLIVWRNPPAQHDSLPIGAILVLLLVLLVIAVGFSVIAYRLLFQKRNHGGLLSPMFLRIWGMFFGVMSVVVLIDIVVRKQWEEAHHKWVLMTASVSMSFAAFALAKKRGRIAPNLKTPGPHSKPQ